MQPETKFADVSTIAATIADSVSANAPRTDDQIKNEEEAAQQEKRVKSALRQLNEQAPRFRKCRLDTFQVRYKEQQPVIARLTKIVANIDRFVRERNQLFLWGPVGTGKDHLAISVLRAAAERGFCVMWREGVEIYEEVAQAISQDRMHSEVYAIYFKPTVLCISDPVFAENWRETKQDALRKLVHRRYNAGKATWITVNLPSLDQADERFGADVYDRLTEKTAIIHCSWPSYRERVKTEF